MQFRIIQQLVQQLGDMPVKIMILEWGKWQEARACHDMNAVRCTTQTDERRVHFPFGGGIEEGKLFVLGDVTPRNHEQSLRIENYIGIAGMIERGQLSYFSMLVTANLDRITVCLA